MKQNRYIICIKDYNEIYYNKLDLYEKVLNV